MVDYKAAIVKLLLNTKITVQKSIIVHIFTHGYAWHIHGTYLISIYLDSNFTVKIKLLRCINVM